MSQIAVNSRVDGPGWVEHSNLQITGLFPLSVERYFNGVVAQHAPAVTTVTANARYYGLHALVAHEARRLDLGHPEAQQLLRRAEVVLGVACRAHQHQDADQHQRGPTVTPHAEDYLKTKLQLGPIVMDEAAAPGEGSYAQAAWGFWNAYRGAEMTLQIVDRTDAFAPGEAYDNRAVRNTLGPVLDLARRNTLDEADLADYPQLCLCRTQHGSDGLWLAGLFAGRGALPGSVLAVQRSTMRMLATAISETKPTSVHNDIAPFVMYHPALLEHANLARDDVARRWRGITFRYESVNAWRFLWQDLVAQVGVHGGLISRDSLRAWMADQMPAETVATFAASLPTTQSGDGRPAAAERDESIENLPSPIRHLSVLLLGARRRNELSGLELLGFHGPPNRRDMHEELGPAWLAHRVATWPERSMPDFAADLSDILINRAQRLSLNKTVFNRKTGRVTIPGRIQVRGDHVFQTFAERASRAPLRWLQLLRMGEQTGLFDLDPHDRHWVHGIHGDLLD